MKKIYPIVIAIFFLPVTLLGQVNKLKFENKNIKKTSFNFKLVNNLVVIPVLINESDTLNFILDTGLKTTLITNLPKKDSLMLKLAQKYTVKGLGTEGDLDVFLSYGNKIKVDGIICEYYNTYILTDDKFDLSGELGMNIHGLIGADIFENFIVRISYSTNRITIYDPDNFKYTRRDKKNVITDLVIYKSKPYIDLNVVNEQGENVKVKLLIDSGSSDALWLFPDTNEDIIVPDKNKYSFLGKGLSGRIYGYNARTKQLKIGRYFFNNITTSFPDSLSIVNSYNQDIMNRNGSIGAEILRRFDVIIDYKNQKLTLHKNKYFKDEFNFNMGGMEVRSIFGIFPIFEVSYINSGSPADKAGIKVGDQIVRINGINTFNYSVIEINSMMRNKEGKKINIIFLRGGVEYKVTFRLKKDL